MKYVLGIDPGVRGAFAVLNSKGKLIEYWLMLKYDMAKLEDNLCKYNYAVVAIEKSQPMPRDGVKQAFGTGLGYGKLIALLELNGISITEVSPQTWQPKILGKTEKGKAKEVVQSLCKVWHPNETFMPGKCTTIHDGVCDAIAIAHYALKYKDELRERA